MNEPKTFEISLDTANKVAQYLATRPYQEVAQLIALLSQLKPIVVPVEAKAE